MSRHKAYITVTYEYVINTTAYGVETPEDAVEVDRAAYANGEITVNDLTGVGKLHDVDWKVGEEIVPQ